MNIVNFGSLLFLVLFIDVAILTRASASPSIHYKMILSSSSDISLETVENNVYIMKKDSCFRK